MGLNMPAKTVVFTSLRKFDGTNFRWVSFALLTAGTHRRIGYKWGIYPDERKGRP